MTRHEEKNYPDIKNNLFKGCLKYQKSTGSKRDCAITVPLTGLVY